MSSLMRKFLCCFVFIGSCSCPGQSYTVGQLVAAARQRNFMVRSEVEKIYRAHNSVHITVAALLPSLNFGTIFHLVLFDILDLVPPLLGFLCPSNWFRWQESKLYLQAERLNYATLVANEINGVESLAYRISSVQYLAGLYQQYITMFKEIGAIGEARRNLGEDPADVSLFFSNTIKKMENDYVTVANQVKKISADLANAIALPAEVDWRTFALRPLELPNLAVIKALRYEDIIQQVLDASLESQAFTVLGHAAHYSTYRRVFDFVGMYSGSSNTLGFGYSSQIKIGRSYQRELSIKKESLISNLILATQRAVLDHNTVLELYKGAVAGLANAEAWHQVLIQKFRAGGELVPQSYMNALEAMMNFHSRVVNAQHLYLITRAQLDRLLWQGDYYRDILSLVPSGREPSPSSVQGGEPLIKGWIHKLKRKYENHRITAALKNKLPKNLLL